MRNRCIDSVKRIIECFDKIDEYRDHIPSEEDFYNETAYSDSCYFRLALIGELTKNKIPDMVKNMHPEIQWNNLYGLRNKIDHNYGDVTFNQRIVWETITEDVPVIKKQFISLLNELEQGGLQFDDEKTLPENTTEDDT